MSLETAIQKQEGINQKLQREYLVKNNTAHLINIEGLCLSLFIHKTYYFLTNFDFKESTNIGFNLFLSWYL